MSEFSETYHLRSERTEDVESLLKQLGLPGYVYPSTNGWVTFVVANNTFEPDPKIIAAAPLLLLHYVYAEDHGWSFALFHQGQPKVSYRCDWEDDIVFDDSQYSRPALLELIPTADTELLGKLEAQLQPDDFDQLFETEPAKIFAQALGLENYDWIAHDYVKSGWESSSEDFQQVIKV